MANDAEAKAFENDRQELLSFKARWQRRKYIRHEVAFHYSQKLIKRGLDEFAKLTDEEPVLADHLSGAVVRYRSRCAQRFSASRREKVSRISFRQRSTTQ